VGWWGGRVCVSGKDEMMSLDNQSEVSITDQQLTDARTMQENSSVLV
jgi:hypothetical protein